MTECRFKHLTEGQTVLLKGGPGSCCRECGSIVPVVDDGAVYFGHSIYGGDICDSFKINGEIACPGCGKPIFWYIERCGGGHGLELPPVKQEVGNSGENSR